LLKTLKKEDVTSKAKLKAMNDSGLDLLKKKHKLPMGHIVLLRLARDELKKNDGARAPSEATSKEDDLDDFEVLHVPPPEAGPVEREERQGEATPLLEQPLSKKHERRPRGDEIRDNYRLPERNDRYGKMKASRNGASAVPGSSSPLPDVRSPSQGGGGGLQAKSQMEEIHRKGVERGDKLSALEHKSRGLASGAMDYEVLCAQLAKKGGKKRKKQKKDKSISAVQPSQQPTQTTPTQTKKKAADHQPQQQGPSGFSHTFPHHSSHSPSHVSPASHHPHGSHSDPILRQSPHGVHNYGTMTEDRPRPTTPTSLTYNSEDETLTPHYEEDVEQRTDGRSRKCCCCCRTM
jgi:hypothetical protein